MARERRRSRVLEYFEQQQAQRQEETDAGAADQQDESPQAGGEENPFQGFDSAFGLDYFDSRGNQ